MKPSIRAWSGLTLLVFGKTEGLPARVRDSLVASGACEASEVVAFEDYGQALDHCKKAKNVGFVFLLEDCGELPPAAVFAQLARPYETKSGRCFGVLVGESPTVAGLTAISEARGLLRFVAASELVGRARCARTVADVWNQFVDAFEATLVPAPLGETLVELATRGESLDQLRFADRVGRLLCRDASRASEISWVEAFALRWSFVINAIPETFTPVLAPHVALKKVCELATREGSACGALHTELSALLSARRSGRLREALEARPGTAVWNERERILEISAQELAALKQGEAA